MKSFKTYSQQFSSIQHSVFNCNHHTSYHPVRYISGTYVFYNRKLVHFDHLHPVCSPPASGNKLSSTFFFCLSPWQWKHGVLTIGPSGDSLSFTFLVLSSEAQHFKFWWSPVCFFKLLVLLVSYLRHHYLNQGREDLHLCFLLLLSFWLKVLWRMCFNFWMTYFVIFLFLILLLHVWRRRFVQCLHFYFVCCMVCGILILQLGFEPTRWQWQHQVLTTGLPGNCLQRFLFKEPVEFSLWVTIWWPF